MTDANDILMGSGASAKFPTVGTTVTGTVLREPEAQQQKNFRTKMPEVWKDGTPKMQVLVQLQTDQRDPEKPNDDGARTLYIKGKYLTQAIREAVRASGANGIHTGGILTVQYVADGTPEVGLDEPPKLYAARYQPPAASFAGVAQPAAAPPATVQQPALAQPVPAPAAVTAPVAASVLGAPAGVDPTVWAGLNPEQRQRVLAAMGQPAQPAQHFGY